MAKTTLEAATEINQPGEETVVVSKKKLESILSRIERLEYAAPKGQLGVYDSRHRGDLGVNAHVNVYQGKIIVAWELVENIVEKNPTTGVWMERQTIRLRFLDETTEDMPYQQFVRRLERKQVKRKSKVEMEDGREVWKVETVETGSVEPQEFDIDIRFIN